MRPKKRKPRRKASPRPKSKRNVDFTGVTVRKKKIDLDPDDLDNELERVAREMAERMTDDYDSEF